MSEEPTGAVLSPPGTDPAPEAGDTPGSPQNGSTGLSGALRDYLARSVYLKNLDDPELDALASELVVVVEPTLPVTSLREALPYLRRPFAPNAIRWKVQVQFGGGQDKSKDPPHSAQIAPYINAATVVDLLNLVTGDLWHDEYERVDNTTLRCHLTIDGVTRTDVGEGPGKAGYSDALKRAAMRFGVGVSLRATPRIVLRSGGKDPKANELRLLSKGNLALTDANLSKLRKGYAEWLEKDGTKYFGEAFDFGDVLDAIGDPDEPADEHAPEGVDPETGEVKDQGPKIRKPRLEALTKLIDTVPPWWTPDDAHQWLDVHKVKLGETDLLTRLKQLRVGEADEFEGWLKGLPVEQPQAPEIA